MDFRISLEKNKKKYKALPLSCAPARDSRGPAQLLGRVGDRGNIEGGFAGVRLRAGEADPAEAVST